MANVEGSETGCGRSFRREQKATMLPFVARRLRQARPARPRAPVRRRTSVEGSGTTSRSHVERQRLLSGPAAEVLFVGQVELVLAGELAGLRRIEEQVEEHCSSYRRARSVKGNASVLKTLHADRRASVTESRSKPARYAAGRFSIWNWRLCVPLPTCNVPKFRFSTVALPAKAAAAWSSTVKVAVVVCERLEEFGIAGREGDRVDAKVRRGSRDRAGLLARHGS